jgi:hypothetical protein
MNSPSRPAMSDPKRGVAAASSADVSKPPWSRMRRRLMARQIGALRFVYYAFWDHCFVTLCAEPLATGGALGTISRPLRERLMRSFERWMALTHPEWRDGPDAAGVLDWNLRTDAHTHHHWGYALHPVHSIDTDHR